MVNVFKSINTCFQVPFENYFSSQLAYMSLAANTVL